MRKRFILPGIVALSVVITLTSYAADQKALPALHMQHNTPHTVGLDLLRTCRFEIQDPPSQIVDGRVNYHWTTLQNWSWHEAVKYIQFRWSDSNPKTTAVAWQVSMVPFTDGKNWQYPPAMVAHKTVQKTGAVGVFTIDFGQFAPLPAKAGSTQKATIPTIHLGSGGQKKADPELLVNAYAAALQQKKLTGTINLYVRIVPLDGKNVPTGFASKTMTIAWGQQPSAPIPDLSSMQPVPAVHPVVKIVRYQPIVWPDSTYPGSHWLRCTRDVPDPFQKNKLLYEKGKDYNFEPRPKSGFEQFLDSWGGLFSFIAQVYEWVSHIYNTVLQDIASLAGPLSPIAYVALEAGASALGMPPSLPSFDDLSSMGKDYLAETLVEQAGLSPEAAKKTVDGLSSAAKEAYSTGGGDKNTLFVPSPLQRYRPAVLLLAVSNPGKTATTAMDVDLEFSKYYPDWKVVLRNYYSPESAAEWQKGPARSYFQNASVHIPSVAPGKTLRVPIALKETFPAPTVEPDVSDRVYYMWFMYGANEYIEHTASIQTRLRDPRPYGGHDNVKQQTSMKFKVGLPGAFKWANVEAQEAADKNH